MLSDGLDVRSGVEQPADLAHNHRQRANIGESDRNAQALLLGQIKNSYSAGRAVDLNRALITSVLDQLNPRDRTRFKVNEHGLPMVRRSIAQAESHSCFGGHQPPDCSLRNALGGRETDRGILR